MIKNIFILIVLFFITNSCTRDDICSGETPTTPLLIITFNDSNNPTARKSVTGLTVRLANSSALSFFKNDPNDSIAIPLNTNSRTTSFIIIRDIDGPTQNSDTINFSYENNAVYINRACGFKNNFIGLDRTIGEGNDGLWVLRSTINKTTVEDEIEAHITIFH